MIEVRSSYVVRATDISEAITLWQKGRDQVWPMLDWNGRIQQMLHGHCQQSLFVWSSTWPSMAAWEEAMRRTSDSTAYQAWSKEMNRIRLFGEEREVFIALEPSEPMSADKGRIEVRSAYMVRMSNIDLAKELMARAQHEVWPEFGWSGQNQQMLHGKAAQSMFVWTSTWDSLAGWEAGMAKTVGNSTFQAWYKAFLAAVEVGGPREIFRNL